MAKILFIGDLHFGHRNGDKETAEYQMQVFDQFIFPLIKKHKIKHIFQSGDFFDSRKAIRHDTMELVREYFIPKTKGQEWHVIVGNHDMHLRENIFPNSVQELLSQYDNFTVYNSPKAVTIDGIAIDMIPWICRDNRQEIMEFINSSASNLCLGHFELSGFQYYKGIESSGESSNFLNNYSQVWSGHFHTISKNKHIQYIGTPYQLTYGDADDERGVWIFDTDDSSFEFVSNNMPKFSRIYFDADTFDAKKLERYAGMNIKITVKNRGDVKKFEKIVEAIAAVAHEISVIDRIDVSQATASGKITVSAIRTVDEIVEEYIDALEETDADKNKIKRIMAGLLADAQK